MHRIELNTNIARMQMVIPHQLLNKPIDLPQPLAKIIEEDEHLNTSEILPATILDGRIYK